MFLMALLSVVLLHSKPVELILVLLIVPIHEIGHYLAGHLIGLQKLRFTFSWLEASVAFRDDLGNKVSVNQGLFFYLAGAIANLLTSIIAFIAFREQSFSFVLVSAIMIATSLTPSLSNNDGGHILSIVARGLKSNKKIKLQMLIWSCGMTVVILSVIPSVLLVKLLIGLFVFVYNFIINSKTIIPLYHSFVQSSKIFDLKPIIILYIFGFSSILVYSLMFIQFGTF
jgi:hypothetical protein